MSTLLDMQGIVKTFNAGTPSAITVLPGVDFHVDRGEFVSVVGQSGSGKTTLMNIIGLLDRATYGYYTFAGENIPSLSDDELAYYRSQNIGFIFQSFNLVGRISALKNVEMPMMYAGINPRDRRERAAHLLEQMGMADRMNHSPAALSGGQKQRVAIARALANDPPLLLADEPTGALDSQTGRMVMDLFHELNREQGKTIVFITHNPELAAETDRIVTMVDGRITEEVSQ
ncbi:ABC transporter ATP-binding protein [Rothia nasimurium]|uniref:ABC transporter ATP-binding protein n=1 Tax=Rothia nasimurium TaxID=85336 RepID=UPI001F48EA34|nr:ABC transporter ATP-binding protein [Rothia nasimurium]